LTGALCARKQLTIIAAKKEESSMRKAIPFLVAIGGMFLLPTIASAQPLVDEVKQGCKTELEKYCSEVTPGHGRVLACLYAHEDKLSGACDYALYDAAAQLERAVNALVYVANECDNDLDKYCSDVQPGEGRLVKCLDKHEKDVSGRCKEAVKQVGLE
jgi:Cysteine rich repeat